ncbi:RING finger protein 151 isoform X3 [Nannospalax galili]|uniref:RING finger protein 151 isoform X3 n=2 Tax=Nannospalax galili TaxID=1026970 RepID=UPI00111C71F6|nr:RING finger protein 151 isoform X3 [Nannospalax galili]
MCGPAAHTGYEMKAPEPWASVELQTLVMSGGYDINLFANPPDCNFLCSVCHGVLKRPVRLSCSHIFCKKCILHWLTRQNTCPCCRKEVKRRKMVHVNKLRKTIGHLHVKCKNAVAGCLVTCPLAYRKEHQDSCPFELTDCPNEGCTAQVLRGVLAEHCQYCQQGGQHCCPSGRGATLAASEHAQHNCYHELCDAWGQCHERNRTLLLSLLGHVRRVHRTTNFIRRQLAQLGNFLEDDALLLSAHTQEAEVTPESEVWEAQGQRGLIEELNKEALTWPTSPPLHLLSMCCFPLAVAFVTPAYLPYLTLTFLLGLFSDI